MGAAKFGCPQQFLQNFGLKKNVFSADERDFGAILENILSDQYLNIDHRVFLREFSF